MSKPFDPYTEWLGVTESHRPPSNHAILGLDSKERQREIVEQHAERQKAKLKEHLKGPQGRLAKRLLYEIDGAAHCLLEGSREASGGRSKAAKPGAPSGQNARAASTAAAGRAGGRGSLDTAAFDLLDNLPPEESVPAGGVFLHAKSPSRASQRQLTRWILAGSASAAILTTALAVLYLLYSSLNHTDYAADESGVFAETPPQQEESAAPPPPPPLGAYDLGQQAGDPEGLLPADQPQPTDGNPAGEEPPSDPEPSPTREVDRFARLPKCVDLPDSQESLRIGPAPRGNTTRLSLELLAASGDVNPRLWVEPMAVDSGQQAWRVLGQPRTGNASSHVATIRLSNGELMFQWEQGRTALAAVGTLRNHVLRIMHGTSPHVIALRTPVVIPPLTIDLSRQQTRVPLEGKRLPVVEELNLEVQILQTSPIAAQIAQHFQKNSVSGTKPLKMLLLHHETPAVDVIWTMQMRSVGTQSSICLSAELCSGSVEVPFTVDRVQTMATALPQEISRLKARLNYVQEAAAACLRRRSAVSTRSMPPAAKTVMLQGIEVELQGLVAQRASIIRQLQLDENRVKVLPVLIELVKNVHKKVKVQGRVYYTVEGQRVDVLQFGSEANPRPGFL